MQERVTNHQQERRWTSPALKVEKVLVGPCLDYMRMSPLVGKVSTSPDLTGRGNAAESLSAWEDFRDSHGHWCPCAWEHDVVWLNITELTNSLLNHTRETLLVQAMHRRQVLPALGPGAWITPEVRVLGSKRQERTPWANMSNYKFFLFAGTSLVLTATPADFQLGCEGQGRGWWQSYKTHTGASSVLCNSLC